MKKIGLLLLVLCCLLTACGSSQTDANQTEDQPQINENDTTAVTVTPLPVTLDIEQLDNCTAAVSLQEGSVAADENGTVQMTVTVYTYDLYDMVDIANLKVGDTIIIRQEEIQITELTRDDAGNVLINGGLDVGGYELHTAENGVYFEIGYSDIKSYFAIGETTLPVSPDFTYTDSSVLEQDPVVYTVSDFLAEDSAIEYHFVPDNTSIVIENGTILSMSRIYTP